MAIALLDQWRERRQAFQLVWAIGMAFYGIAAGCEAIAAAAGWNEALYKTWYLTGAVLTAGWLGLGTALLLSKTRFGYAVAISIFLAGLFTLLTQAKYHYEGAGSTPILYFIGAGLLALAIAVETYFQNERWPLFMAIGVVAASVLALFLTVTATLSQPYLIDTGTGQPIADLFPGSLRLLIVCVMHALPGLAFAVGESVNGFPNWEERVLHEWTNRARSDPQVEMIACGANCGDAARMGISPWDVNPGRHPMSATQESGSCVCACPTLRPMRGGQSRLR